MGTPTPHPHFPLAPSLRPVKFLSEISPPVPAKAPWPNLTSIITARLNSSTNQFFKTSSDKPAFPYFYFHWFFAFGPMVITPSTSPSPSIHYIFSITFS
nr:hypothetical protein [Bacillus sp. SDF0016]